MAEDDPAVGIWETDDEAVELMLMSGPLVVRQGETVFVRHLTHPSLVLHFEQNGIRVQRPGR